jgi:hypothetical protein
MSGRTVWPVVVLACAAAAVPARAYEDQLTFDVTAGYGNVPLDGALPTHGALLGVAGSLGLDDAFSLRAQVSYGFHPSAAEDFHLLIGGAEVIYLLDILEVVPFGGLGLDALGTSRGGRVGVDFGAHIVLGVDYLLSREMLIGLDLRSYYLPLNVSFDAIDPIYLSANLRLSWIFDM